MTIITVTSSKGGVGKTTTSVSLAAGLANLHECLLLDADSQGHVALAFGLPVRGGLADWLLNDLPAFDCTLTGRPAELTILPGDSTTKHVERVYAAEGRFAELVARLGLLDAEYPYVVVDTSSRGILQECAIAAADVLVVPFEPETFGIDGLHGTLAIVAQLNPDAPTVLLPTLVDRRIRVHQETIAELLSEFGVERMGQPVPARSAVKRAIAAGQTIWEHNDSGIVDARVAYAQLIDRVMALASKQVLATEGV
jgi:chromosome partitioning protein